MFSSCAGFLQLTECRDAFVSLCSVQPYGNDKRPQAAPFWRSAVAAQRSRLARILSPPQLLQLKRESQQARARQRARALQWPAVLRQGACHNARAVHSEMLSVGWHHARWTVDSPCAHTPVVAQPRVLLCAATGEALIGHRVSRLICCTLFQPARFRRAPRRRAPRAQHAPRAAAALARGRRPTARRRDRRAVCCL